MRISIHEAAKIVHAEFSFVEDMAIIAVNTIRVSFHSLPMHFDVAFKEFSNGIMRLRPKGLMVSVALSFLKSKLSSDYNLDYRSGELYINVNDFIRQRMRGIVIENMYISGNDIIIELE